MVIFETENHLYNRESLLHPITLALFRIKIESEHFQSSTLNAQHDEIHLEDYLNEKLSQQTNKINLESGPFQAWHNIAQHCEIQLEYYLNEKRYQFRQQ